MADLKGLAGSGASPEDLEAAILDEFVDVFKAKRVEDFIRKGSSSSAIDRFESASYPLSVRLQVQTQYRATALLLPKFKHAVITHVFHKSADPKYMSAARTHDARLAGYFEGIAEYSKKRR
jgi:hypothetical protein